ncbi:MAG: diguanylate cyclase, partial [Candidatus Rokuibacteriota bacterium]
FRKNPQILSSIVDAMVDGLFTCDADGNLVSWSDGAARITGYAADEVVGNPCRVLEGPNGKGFSTVHDLLAQSEPPEGVCLQECKFRTKDGRELDLLGKVRVLTDEAGRVRGAVGTFTHQTSSMLGNERIALRTEQPQGQHAFGGLVGRSSPMQGESGTGKELVARAIHDLNGRRDRPFVAVNCSAVPETLLESELFGHVKGAFTGADRDKTGVFQAAHGGTLFLDEIGDVSPLLQVKLLRVLQEREVRRVGDTQATKVDVRLVTATNRGLESLRAAGTLREDFYYRIRVYEIALPPLRDRREDVPLLVEHFIAEFGPTHKKNVAGITDEALQCLLDYPWPGNVRELRNAIECAFVAVSGDQITLLDLPPELRRSAVPHPLQSRLTPAQEAERQRIQLALEQERGNKTAAAKRLGISRVALWKKMRRLQVAGPASQLG